MIKPLYDRVLVEPTKITEESTLTLPESKGEGLQTGTVIAVGDYNPETGQPLRIKEGDVVMFGAFSGLPVQSDGKDYLVIREKNIEVIL